MRTRKGTDAEVFLPVQEDCWFCGIISAELSLYSGVLSIIPQVYIRLVGSEPALFFLSVIHKGAPCGEYNNEEENFYWSCYSSDHPL